MINTDYSSLVNRGSSSSWQTVTASNETLEKEVAVQNSKSSTFDDTAVILTLSKQADGVNLKSTGVSTYATTPTLKMGSSGNAVYELQRNLTVLGYSTNGIDGIFGNDTKNAVISFQKAYGLSADGIVGSETQYFITKAMDYHNKGILTVGSRGARVTELQKNLTKLGYSTKGTDGIFGTATRDAVISFQRDHGLKPDGMAGMDTRNAILKAVGSSNTSGSSENSATIQRMLDNLKNDTSLGLSADKKAAMLVAAERLLNENYEVEFVAGVLGNIQNEGTPGQFENSNFDRYPSAKPSYLEYMDNHFDYRVKFSNKSIQEVGISAALELAKKAEKSGYQGKFGLGMIQWTADRTLGLLESYQIYSSGDKPTKEECIKAEVNFLLDELEGDKAFVYKMWKEGNKTASSAGDIVCRYYEIPGELETQATLRAENAEKIYDVLMK